MMKMTMIMMLMITTLLSLMMMLMITTLLSLMMMLITTLLSLGFLISSSTALHVTCYHKEADMSYRGCIHDGRLGYPPPSTLPSGIRPLNTEGAVTESLSCAG